MIHLHTLNAEGKCGITDVGISAIKHKLTELEICGKDKITTY